MLLHVSLETPHGGRLEFLKMARGASRGCRNALFQVSNPCCLQMHFFKLSDPCCVEDVIDLDDI